jgi:hypothetical protein
MGHRAVLALRACLALRLAPNPPGLPRSHKTTWQHAAGSGPRRRPRHLAIMMPLMLPSPLRDKVGHLTTRSISGLIPFTCVAACYLPCLRFEAVVPTHLRMGGPRAPQNSVPGCWLDITGAPIAGRLVLCASRRTPLRTVREPLDSHRSRQANAPTIPLCQCTKRCGSLLEIRSRRQTARVL